MHCDGLFHRDKVILSQTSTTGHPLPANQNSELLFMPTQSNNRILYFETDYSGRRSDDQSTAFSRDGNLEKRNDVQLWTKPQEDNSSMVSTSSKGCRRSISPDFSTGSESFYGHEVQRNVFPGFVFDHMHSSDFVPTQIGKQSHDEEFHEVDHLPFNETVSYSCRADSASNVVIEFDCKVRCCVNAFIFYQIHSHWVQSLLLRLAFIADYLLKKDKLLWVTDFPFFS